MNFIEWLLGSGDSLASHDVIDSYFEQTSLVDIVLTDAELAQTADFDRLAEKTAKNYTKKRDVPKGKQVF